MKERPQDRARRRLAAETRLGSRPPVAADLAVCLVYPNTYPVGMANLGFQAIYGILAESGVAVERAFLGDRGDRSPLRTLETGRPLFSQLRPYPDTAAEPGGDKLDDTR